MKLVVSLVLAVVALAAGTARADVPKKCLAPLVFVPGEGCMKPPPPKATSADPYYRGLAIIDSDPKRAFALFEESCTKKYAPACTQIGIFHAFGRSRVVVRDAAKANTYWQQACDLGDGAGCQRRGNAATNAAEYAVARRYFERGCERRDGAACAQLAFSIERGFVGKADPASAKPVYAKAHKILAQTCTPKNGYACFVRGLMYENGYGVTANVPEAVKAYEAACTAKNPDACVSLVSHYEKAKQPEAKIVAALETACVYDNAAACSTVARRMTISDAKSTRAVELAERGCQLDTKQCGILAELYRGGRGTKEDQAKATALFKSVCETGDHSICVTYAVRLRLGVGVTADTTRATTVLDDACRADEPDGCKHLALYLSNDKTDDVRAYKAAVKGCTLKSGYACYLAGWMIQHTRRGDPSQPPAAAGKEALPHHETGCELGSPEACDAAGDLHRDGVGTPQDPKRAFERYQQGCDNETPSGNACGSLAVMAYNGAPPVEKDRKLAARAASRGCVNDQAYACKWLPSVATEPDLVALVAAELAPACQRGKHDVCLWQARTLMWRGDRAAKQQGLALALATCGHRHEASCTQHAAAIYYGQAGDEDKAKGEALYKQYCEDGHASACSELSTVFSQKKDAVSALRYADTACTLKNAEGCTQAGYQHYTAQPGVEWRIDKAAEYYQRSCELGSTSGCANHAELLRYGIYTKIDHAKAYKLYQQACDGDNAYGCAGAASYIATGEGGAKQDVKLALQMFKTSCEKEIPEGCVGVAEQMERQREGTAPEIERLRQRAMSLATKYADENPMYRYWVGTFHRDGMATAKDPAKALTWFVKACEGYDPLGCIAAGKALAQSAKPADREQARAYFGRACAAGIEDGCAGKLAVGASPTRAGTEPAKGPPAVARGKGCACGGQVAPDAQGALLVLALGALVLRRRRR